MLVPYQTNGNQSGVLTVFIDNDMGIEEDIIHFVATNNDRDEELGPQPMARFMDESEGITLL